VNLRDDRALASRLAPLGRRAPQTPLTLLSVLPPLALTATGRSHATMAAAVAWMVILGGASSGARTDRFTWLVPGLLRAGEYGLLIWMGGRGGFALAFALTLLHYDLVYRPRHLGAEPVVRWAGGWDGRLVVAWILLAVGAAPVGLYVLAGLIAAIWLAGSPLIQRRQGDAA
jgi:hypothetical protein